MISGLVYIQKQYVENYLLTFIHRRISARSMDFSYELANGQQCVSAGDMGDFFKIRQFSLK